MRFNKLTLTGSAKSLSVRGILFRNGTPTYLTDAELPMGLAALSKLHVASEVTEADKRPDAAAAVAGAVSGVMWTGNSLVKLTDWGTFHKNVARRDLPADAVDRLLQKGGFVRV